MNNRGVKSIAFGEIYLLIIGIFAFSALLGNAGLVSGELSEALKKRIKEDPAKAIDDLLWAHGSVTIPISNADGTKDYSKVDKSKSLLSLIRLEESLAFAEKEGLLDDVYLDKELFGSPQILRDDLKRAQTGTRLLTGKTLGISPTVSATARPSSTPTPTSTTSTVTSGTPSSTGSAGSTSLAAGLLAGSSAAKTPTIPVSEVEKRASPHIIAVRDVSHPGKEIIAVTTPGGTEYFGIEDSGRWFDGKGAEIASGSELEKAIESVHKSKGAEEAGSEGGSSGEKLSSSSSSSSGGVKKPTSKLLNTIEVEGFFLANLADGVNWALAAIGGIQTIGRLANLQEDEVNSISLAVGAGLLAGKTTFGVFEFFSKGKGDPKKIFSTKEGNVLGLGGKGQALVSAGVGIAVALFVLQETYEKKQTRKQVRTFQCLPWEPPLGGEACETCNEDPFRPCSEYRCRSLGQACEIVNPGTEEERCVWVSPKDVTSPTIEPWDEALRPVGEDLKYAPDQKRPPSRGTKIVRGSQGCLRAFTPLQFGLTTNEPAQCKVDLVHTEKFDDMQYFLGGTNLFVYNHTERFTLPNSESDENATAFVLPSGENFEMYVRCRDANGNENTDEYVVSFCVDDSPDTTPPVIDSTSIPDGSFVQFDVDNVPIELYVNEPAECKWSRQSKSYEEMENELSCQNDVREINANLLYACSGELTGVKNQEDNEFFFRCKDKPGSEESERNVNVQSYDLTLKGSRPLDILEVSPNETISGSTSTVPVTLEVETSNGAEEGKAICLFSQTGSTGDYVEMFETEDFRHTQVLDLTSGNYEIFFRCVDAGGNVAEQSTEFNVFIDKQAPRITRVYREGALKVVTDEDAQCVYSLNGCNYNFDEGLALIYSNPSIRNSHFVDWDPEANYHIKCKDDFGNEPEPSSCSVVVNGVDLA